MTVSRILGHSSIEMTMICVHPTTEIMRSAVKRLGKIYELARQKISCPTFLANKKEKQRHMLLLITKGIYTCAYTGPLLQKKDEQKRPRVSKLHSRNLNFEWTEEFQILYELSVIKKLSPEGKGFVDKKGGGSGPEGEQVKANKKNKLSTIQQKLEEMSSCRQLIKYVHKINSVRMTELCVILEEI